ncbi:MAG: hypothetical protein QOJ07_2696 [Thermoleophilaceae bacterium]|nr:hypothetical protein [Thermoleophilaceae bacterium]
MSGAAELAGGLMALVPRLRPFAGLWLIALLVAVFPANVQMALHPARYDYAAWLLYVRLPLQVVIGALVWWALEPGRLRGYRRGRAAAR